MLSQLDISSRCFCWDRICFMKMRWDYRDGSDPQSVQNIIKIKGKYNVMKLFNYQGFLKVWYKKFVTLNMH